VPESDIFCGLIRALSVITTLADREPVARGVNVTLIVHEEPARSVAAGSVPAGEIGQVLGGKSEKSAELLPAIVMPLIVSAVAPVFFSVTALAALLVPTFTVPKLKLHALSQAWGLITVAVSATSCGLLKALSATLSVAVCGV